MLFYRRKISKESRITIENTFRKVVTDLTGIKPSKLKKELTEELIEGK